MGNKQLQSRVVCGSAIDKELLSRLRDYSGKTGIPISKLLDKAILFLLEGIFSKEQLNVLSNILEDTLSSNVKSAYKKEIEEILKIISSYKYKI